MRKHPVTLYPKFTQSARSCASFDFPGIAEARKFAEILRSKYAIPSMMAYDELNNGHVYRKFINFDCATMGDDRIPCQI